MRLLLKPCLGQDLLHEASSGSSTGSDWFDASSAHEDVPDEEWLDAGVAPGDISTEWVSSPSSSRRGSGRTPHRSCIHEFDGNTGLQGRSPPSGRRRRRRSS
jgi:hypothetical protein